MTDIQIGGITESEIKNKILKYSDRMATPSKVPQFPEGLCIDVNDLRNRGWSTNLNKISEDDNELKQNKLKQMFSIIPWNAGNGSLKRNISLRGVLHEGYAGFAAADVKFVSDERCIVVQTILVTEKIRYDTGDKFLTQKWSSYQEIFFISQPVKGSKAVPKNKLKFKYESYNADRFMNKGYGGGVMFGKRLPAAVSTGARTILGLSVCYPVDRVLEEKGEPISNINKFWNEIHKALDTNDAKFLENLIKFVGDDEGDKELQTDFKIRNDEEVKLGTENNYYRVKYGDDYGYYNPISKDYFNENGGRQTVVADEVSKETPSDIIQSDLKFIKLHPANGLLSTEEYGCENYKKGDTTDPSNIINGLFGIDCSSGKKIISGLNHVESISEIFKVKKTFYEYTLKLNLKSEEIDLKMLPIMWEHTLNTRWGEGVKGTYDKILTKYPSTVNETVKCFYKGDTTFSDIDFEREREYINSSEEVDYSTDTAGAITEDKLKKNLYIISSEEVAGASYEDKLKTNLENIYKNINQVPPPESDPKIMFTDEVKTRRELDKYVTIIERLQKLKVFIENNWEGATLKEYLEYFNNESLSNLKQINYILKEFIKFVSKSNVDGIFDKVLGSLVSSDDFDDINNIDFDATSPTSLTSTSLTSTSPTSPTSLTPTPPQSPRPKGESPLLKRLKRYNKKLFKQVKKTLNTDDDDDDVTKSIISVLLSNDEYNEFMNDRTDELLKLIKNSANNKKDINNEQLEELDEIMKDYDTFVKILNPTIDYKLFMDKDLEGDPINWEADLDEKIRKKGVSEKEDIKKLKTLIKDYKTEYNNTKSSTDLKDKMKSRSRILLVLLRINYYLKFYIEGRKAKFYEPLPKDYKILFKRYINKTKNTRHYKLREVSDFITKMETTITEDEWMVGAKALHKLNELENDVNNFITKMKSTSSKSPIPPPRPSRPSRPSRRKTPTEGDKKLKAMLGERIDKTPTHEEFDALDALLNENNSNGVSSVSPKPPLIPPYRKSKFDLTSTHDLPSLSGMKDEFSMSNIMGTDKPSVVANARSYLGK